MSEYYKGLPLHDLNVDRVALVEALIAAQQQNRKPWTEIETVESTESMIVEEWQELTDLIKAINVTPLADFELASEIGDIVYLSLKLIGINQNATPTAVAAWSVAVRTAAAVNMCPLQAATMKVIRNAIKYNDFATGFNDQSKSRSYAKQFYSDLGGDKAFYTAYMKSVNENREISPEVDAIILS